MSVFNGQRKERKKIVFQIHKKSRCMRRGSRKAFAILHLQDNGFRRLTNGGTIP